MKKYLALVLLLVLVSNNAAAQSDFASFLEMRKEERAEHPQWSQVAGGDLCKSLTDAKLGCSYGERYALLHFLHDHGVVMFTCGDGMNPYIDDICDQLDTERYVYIGTLEQNMFFAKALQRNITLFSDGSFTSEEVSLWK